MFPDYHLAVWQAYQKKKADGDLSPNLKAATKAKLRDECLLLFNRRYDPTCDKFAFEGIYPEQQTEEDLRIAIGKDPDKFKRLEDILGEGLSKTGDKYIEMLAFLIDFKPRPGHRWEKRNQPVSSPEEANELSKGVAGEAVTDSVIVNPFLTTAIEEPQEEEEQRQQKYPGKKWRWMLAACFLFLTLTGGIIYKTFNTQGSDGEHKGRYVILRPKGKCMYWAEDHYIAGSCNVLHRDTPVVQLDSFKLENFKKLNDWSALNESAIGKVWWARVHKKLELYTTDGFHPIDTNRGLRPLSEYMFNEYIRPVLK